MIDLTFAKKELQSAEKAISMMKNSKNFSDFEFGWNAYLASIERCWNKIEDGCQSKRNKFQPWQEKFIKLRKKDSLLRYIKQARDADTHSIQEIIKHKKGGYGIKPLKGSTLNIESFKINGKVIEYKSDPIVIEAFPEKVELLRFKNRGKWYNRPTQHLDKKLISIGPIAIAKKGLDVYKQFVDDAGEKFSN